MQNSRTGQPTQALDDAGLPVATSLDDPDANMPLDVSVEYYGSLGSPTDLLPGEEQVHQFFFGGDIALAENVVLNLGVGVGTTDVGNRLVYKSRLGWMF